ncbi:von Willebrand factor type A domain protein [Corynebacterium heidelbergense]|nr:von Willebrand factor type A domain protein [Corynebacterium heidelbergense]
MTRIDAAKQATSSLIDALGPQQRFGLLTYGTQTGSSDEEKAAGCADVTELRPVSQGDVDRAKAAVASVIPRGYTPIGAALRKAAAALPSSGPRSVVVVSDGVDTCAPPPVCEVARELKGQGVDLVVNTIGLNIDEQGRRDLECVAQVTGGSYADAGDAASLTEKMKVATRAGEGYSGTGQRIDGAPGKWDGSGGADTWVDGLNFESAPVVHPGLPTTPLLIRTELPAFPQDFPATGASRSGQHAMARTYKVHLEEGDVLYVGVVAPPVEGTARLSEGEYRGTVRVNYVTPNPNGRPSASPGGYDSAPSTGKPAYVDETIVAQNSGDYGIVVVRDGPFLADQPLPVQVSLSGHKAVRSTTPARAITATDRENAVKDVGPNPKPVTGGTGPDTAVPIEANSPIESDLIPGETRFFSVPLEWGQDLAIAAKAVDPETPKGQAGCLEAEALAPTFSKVVDRGTRDCSPLSGTPSNNRGAALRRYMASTLGFDPQNPNGVVAGRQVIGVTLQSKPGQTGASAENRQPMKFHMRAVVTGTPVSGPEFQPLTDSANQKQPSNGSDPAGQSQPDAAGKSDSKPVWFWPALALGGLVAIGLVAGTLLMIRRLG